MADKTPVRVVFNASNVATGMAEFQSGETVPVSNGGTGLAAIGSAGQVLRTNAAGNALEFATLEDLADIVSVGSTLTAPSNADFNITTAGTGNIVLNDLSISDNTLTTNRSNDDLHINASGTGTVVLENLKIGTSGSTVTTILDEDAMGSNSATSLATQQSIKAYVDAQVATKDNSDEITEGSTNLYFTNARADARITAALIDEDDMSSNSATRLPSQQSVKAYVDGEVSSLSSTTITQGNSSVVVSDTGSNGAITLTAEGNTELVVNDTSATFSGNVIVAGDFTVNGTTTTVSTTNTAISDNIIELNSGTSSSGNDAGIIIERGSTGNNAAIIWDESADTFVLGTTTATAGDKSGGITIDAGSLKIASLEVDGVTITDNTIGANASNSSLELEASGTGDIDLNAGADVNIPANIGLTFGNDGEKIEGDGTDLTIASSNDLDLVSNGTGTQSTLITSAGGIYLDSAESNRIDAATGTTNFYKAGVLGISLNIDGNNDTVLHNRHNNKDIKFDGQDDNSTITALTLDMSAAGAATFNAGVTATTGTFSGNVAISGDLTVSGNTSTVSTTNTTIADNIIELNTGISQSLNDAGIIIERGSTGNNAFIGWDESADKFSIGTTTATAADKSGGISVTKGTLLANIEGNVTGNVSGSSGSTTGNAATATALATARNIAGQSFDGTGNITIASTDLSNTSAITLNTASQTLTNKILTSPVINSPTSDKFKFEGSNFTDSILIGHATTGTLDSAEDNTGVGLQTLESITSGDSNVAIGSEALLNLTTGSDNTVVGTHSGTGIVGGSFNTIFGKGSGNVITSGQYNVILGRSTNTTTTTGSGNVMIGNERQPSSNSASGELKIGNFIPGTGSLDWISGDSSGNLTTVGDVTLANNKKVIFGDAGENIVGDGTDLTISSSRNVTIDVDSAISLDADSNGIVNFKDGGAKYFVVQKSSSSAVLSVDATDGDMIFKGDDGGSVITALTLDMSAAGAATFNAGVTATGVTISGASILDGVTITDNTISTNASNAPLEIIANGTGPVKVTSGGVTFTLPTADGNAGDFLKTDGSGTLSFASSGGTASDDTRVVIKNNKAVGSSARTVDYFQATSADMAWYFMALNDLSNDHSSASCFSVAHNNSNAFIGSPRGGSSGSSNSLPNTTADISSGQVRVKITAPSSDAKISYYKIPISRANTANETAGVTVTTANTDVDSASESIDSFAHASFRAAKYTILIDNDAKTETGVTEALVVHNGTDAFVSQFGTVNTGNNDMITLTAAISGSNVVLSAAGLEPNLSLKIHKILLSDSMSAVSNSNQKIIGATTVSSSATAFDNFDLDNAVAAVYYVVGKNATEGAFSVQEVFCSGAPGEASVSTGPFVSTKATTQLEFTAGFKSDEDNSVELSISSTSGGSTVVNAYRINCLAE